LTNTSLPAIGPDCNPIAPGVEWLARRSPGMPSKIIRESLPPVIANSHAKYPVRIDPASICLGDRIGNRVIVNIVKRETRHHGWPCHCMWGTHVKADCTYDYPSCPCHATDTDYTFTCHCDCGLTSILPASSLICGRSLSCLHCRHVAAARKLAEAGSDALVSCNCQGVAA